MKKLFMRIILLTLTLIMAVSVVGVQAFAVETELSYTTLFFMPGKETDLKLKGYSGNVSWSVSDEKVAKIIPNGTSCHVTAVTYGTVSITAKTSQGSYQCTMYVRAGYLGSMLPIISEDTIQITEGESAQQQYSFYKGSKNICVKVCDEDIISITEKKNNDNSISFYVNGLKDGVGRYGLFFKEDPSNVIYVNVDVRKNETELSADSQQEKDGEILSVSKSITKKKSVTYGKLEFIVPSNITKGCIHSDLPCTKNSSDPYLNQIGVYKVYIYDPQKKKYCLYDEDRYENKLNRYVSVNINGLDYRKEYSIIIRCYFDGDLVYQYSGKAYPEPGFSMYNDTKKCKITFDTLPAQYDGVEVYTYDDISCESVFFINPDDAITLTNEIKKTYPSIKLVYRKTKKDPAGTSITIDGKQPKFVYVRYFKNVNGKRVYNNCFCDYTTLSLYAQINTVKLDPQIVTSGEELRLVKEFVNEYITDDMTNEEKFCTLITEIKKRGKYQFDINKIDGNRPVWQLLVKGEGQCATWAFATYDILKYVGFDVKVVRGVRENGDQHFWCKVNLNGYWFTIDTQLGGFYAEPSPSSGEYISYIPQEYYG